MALGSAISAPTLAEAARPETQLTEPKSSEEELILTVRANGVERGEFTLRRRADGDFWIAAEDYSNLKLKPVHAAQRKADGQEYYSLEALGATGIVFDEHQLTLDVDFPMHILETTRIDLSSRTKPVQVDRPQNSAIVNYRAAARHGGGNAQGLLAAELNVRLGELLLRQEAKYETGLGRRRLVRGLSQAIFDHRQAGIRVLAGDQFAFGGTFGTSFTGAGLSLSRLYAITPDVLRQPTAAFRLAASAPAEVEVAVDGSTVYRSRVGPGPIAVDNLFYSGGSRTVRVTVTDAAGRRQVLEQPFLFTDSVLAKGMHEYSYFIGRRSELAVTDRWRYREGAWQGFHRYGATNSLTLQAGGEGSREFASGGFGASLRHDVLGLASLDVLGSTERASSRQAHGWSARYTYLAPNGSFFVGRRQYGDGFRTLATTLSNPAFLNETRAGASARIFSAVTLSGDLVRGRDARGDRDGYAVRFSSSLDKRTSLHAEYQSSRTGVQRDWSVNIFLRFDLEQQRWAATTVRSTLGSRSFDAETGKQLGQGEGVGYRVGVTSNWQAGQSAALSFASANWNLKTLTLDFSASSQLQGGRSHFAEVAAAGALVALDGYAGLTRRVADSFALARLGVPLPGVEVFVNNQSQGRTDARGMLLVPDVGAYGRQDVSLDDSQMPMQYELRTKRVTIAPPYRSGTLVNFDAHKLQAVAGYAWVLQAGARKPIPSRAWTLTGEGRNLRIETAPTGDFYVEDAAPGVYNGSLDHDGKAYACRLNVPAFEEAVHELQEGILCE